MASGTRRAAIIGIDRYADDQISRLRGARNDAREMHERLTTYGDFTIDDRHLLLDDDATAANIRRAISDLLWKTDRSDLSLLYFSGHGLTDAYGNGYIAPHDMIRDDPFVFGIRMQELREFMLAAKNKRTVLLIFDCCYSGIAAAGDPGGAAPPGAALENCLAPLNEARMVGEGRLILTSAGKDQRSREVSDSRHRLGGEAPHPHGAFTFQLLEGLDGKAARDGRDVTLQSLVDCVNLAFNGKSDHQPKLYGSAASSLDAIVLSRASRQEELDRKVEEVTALLVDESNLFALFKAIKILRAVLTDSPGLVPALDLRSCVDDRLAILRNGAAELLLFNALELSEGCEDTFLTLRNTVCQDVLDYQTVSSQEPGLQNLILCLFQAAGGQADQRVLQRSLVAYHGRNSHKLTGKPEATFASAQQAV